MKIFKSKISLAAAFVLSSCAAAPATAHDSGTNYSTPNSKVVTQGAAGIKVKTVEHSKVGVGRDQAGGTQTLKDRAEILPTSAPS